MIIRMRACAHARRLCHAMICCLLISCALDIRGICAAMMRARCRDYYYLPLLICCLFTFAIWYFYAATPLRWLPYGATCWYADAMPRWPCLIIDILMPYRQRWCRLMPPLSMISFLRHFAAIFYCRANISFCYDVWLFLLPLMLIMPMLTFRFDDDFLSPWYFRFSSPFIFSSSVFLPLSSAPPSSIFSAARISYYACWCFVCWYLIIDAFCFLFLHYFHIFIAFIYFHLLFSLSLFSCRFISFSLSFIIFIIIYIYLLLLYLLILLIITIYYLFSISLFIFLSCFILRCCRRFRHFTLYAHAPCWCCRLLLSPSMPPLMSLYATPCRFRFIFIICRCPLIDFIYLFCHVIIDIIISLFSFHFWCGVFIYWYFLYFAIGFADFRCCLADLRCQRAPYWFSPYTLLILIFILFFTPYEYGVIFIYAGNIRLLCYFLMPRLLPPCCRFLSSAAIFADAFFALFSLALRFLYHCFLSRLLPSFHLSYFYFLHYAIWFIILFSSLFRWLFAFIFSLFITPMFCLLSFSFIYAWDWFIYFLIISSPYWCHHMIARFRFD